MPERRSRFHRKVVDRILDYAVSENFRGYDPFDGLNSRVFQATPLRHSRLARLVITQAMKRLPFNLRQMLDVPKRANPKGLALFLSGALDLYRATREARFLAIADALTGKLAAAQRTGYSGACWGYPFPWQSRAFYLERHTPTVVVTSYVAWALLDAYDVIGDPAYLDLARSACDFIQRDLNRLETPDGICFSYSPNDVTQVHNASLLGARLLARVGKLTNEADLIDLAEQAVEYSVHGQTAEGAWAYGSARYQRWVDSFHTGFNLECIHDFCRYTGRDWPKAALERGLVYYRDRLFLLDGTARYFHDRTHPLDTHAFAQAILTFTKLRNLDAAIPGYAGKVLEAALRQMLGPNGMFYYQRHRAYSNGICYLRWSQAWMFRALSAYLLASKTSANGPESPH